MNKILVGIGILLGSILIVENMVVSTTAYVFIWYSSTGTLAILSLVIGAVIGYGSRGLTMKDDTDEDSGYNF